MMRWSATYIPGIFTVDGRGMLPNAVQVPFVELLRCFGW